MPKRKHAATEAAGQTVAIKLADVPEYLQSGELFKSMQCEDGSSLEVPVTCVKSDQIVHSEEDAWSLLHSLRYWIAGTELPSSLVAYCLSSGGTELPASFWETFAQQFRSLGALRTIVMDSSGNLASDRKVRIAILTGDMQLVRGVHETLKCLLPTGCADAALSGNLACLQFVHDRMPINRRQPVIRASVHSGSLNCLKFAVSQGYIVDREAFVHAAELGRLSCLQFLSPADEMKPWHEDVCTAAVDGGHQDCLEFAVGQCGLPSSAVTEDAAAQGNIACLEYLHAQGAPWSAKLCCAAARNDETACLSYLRECGCPWDESTCVAAIRGGHLDCLKYAHKQGCPWDCSVCTEAAEDGNLECLVYAHEQGCPWDATTCSAAARWGHLDCLQYAHEQGCPWNAETCMGATCGDHLGCLQYAREHGCPWDSRAWRCARYATCRTKTYLQEHGCPPQLTDRKGL